MRLGVAGVDGRMGRLVVQAIRAAPAASLAGGIGRPGDPPGAPDGVRRFGDLAALAAECDAVIDFTGAGAVAGHAEALAASGIGWVLGSTGLDTASWAAIDRAATRIPLVQAANFSAGAAVLTALAERLGRALPAPEYDAEIWEMHHRHKIDAPSGTALALGEAVAAGRGVRLSEVARRGRDGAAGPRGAAEIGFAVSRGGEVVGEHTLSFTGAGEQITIAHRAFDRGVFAAGAVQAALWLHRRPAGRYGMRDVLGLG